MIYPLPSGFLVFKFFWFSGRRDGAGGGKDCGACPSLLIRRKECRRTVPSTGPLVVSTGCSSDCPASSFQLLNQMVHHGFGFLAVGSIRNVATPPPPYGVLPVTCQSFETCLRSTCEPTMVFLSSSLTDPELALVRFMKALPARVSGGNLRGLYGSLTVLPG